MSLTERPFRRIDKGLELILIELKDSLVALNDRVGRKR